MEKVLLNIKYIFLYDIEVQKPVFLNEDYLNLMKYLIVILSILEWQDSSNQFRPHRQNMKKILEVLMQKVCSYMSLSVLHQWNQAKWEISVSS